MTERDIFLGALEREEPAPRAAYLDAACAGQPALRQRVEELLRLHRNDPTFLNVPVMEQLDAGEETLAFLAPATGPDEIGWLAHYRVLKVLGRGGMGIVLHAEDTQLRRPVALKVIRPELGQSPLNRQRFLREARAMAQVKSDHVVTVHQVGQENDVCYLAMELLDGEPLDRWLERTGRPPPGEAVRIGREIALALGAAHARGLVHRDVKPANVWLEAPARRVKLLDFGLARPLDAATHLTRSGIVVGTPAYLAPEQARGEAVDGRADLFSLGCILYLMATGRPSFEGKTPLSVLTAVLTATPPPAGELNPSVPAPMSDLISRLLAKEPAARPDSAGVVVAELQAVERALSLLARPATQVLPVDRTGRPASPADPASSGIRPTPPPADTTAPTTPLRPREPGAKETPPARRRAREAERRQVTVLVCGCDLFESETYLEGLDGPARAGVLRAFQQACERAVSRFDGAVVQCTQEGLLACFGYPVAHEDAARRAARTGLGILEALKALGEPLRRQHRLELNPWVGLHTGPAVVEAGEEAVSLGGEARTVAVRLRDGAEPGQLICTGATHRLIRGEFDCAGLGRSTIRGLAQPVELFRVQGAGVTRSPVDAAAPAGLSPLTGRDHEVSLLKDRWEQAREGVGHVVLLVGEPGLGKSRLVYTMKEHVLGQTVEGEVDAPVIEWRCSPHYQNTGLYPAIDFYDRALGLRPEEPPQTRFDRVLRRLEQYGLARPETVPLWAALLSLPTPDRFPPLALSPVRQREETFRAMLEWLRVRAARRPVLFVVEDLHWVDASTLEFLGEFVAEGLHDSILTVLTFRPEFKTPWPAVAHQTSLALSRLTRRQVGDLMRKKTGAAVPDALVDQVYDRTGGVPLFVEEFTQMVQESGALDQSGEAGPRVEALRTHEIPATLQDLVLARLDRMDEERELAQLAAVLGREFGHELLAAVAAVDEPTLQAQSAELIQAEILSAKGRPPRCSYMFKHALLEDALYNSLVKGKRQQFHRRVAEALESRFPQTTETRPELLAHHFTEAGLAGRAIGYWLKAGLRSRERSANVEAIGHLTKGLELLVTLDESPERDAQELQFLNPLGSAYQAARGYAAAEAGPVFRRARELCDRIGQPLQRFVVMWGNWAWHAVGGDFRRCIELAAEVMEFADRVDDPGMKMEALFQLGFTMFNRADFAGAREHCGRAVADYDDPERTKKWAAYTGQDAGATHRIYLALALWHLGYPDRALSVNREARVRARTLGQPFTLAEVANRTSWLYQHCRLGAEAVAAAEEGSAIAAEQGFAYWRATAMVYKAAGIVLQGRPGEALPLLLQGLDAYRATRSGMALPYYLSILGDTYTQAGRFPDARTALDEGLALAEKNDDRFQEAELHRLKGELHLAEADEQTAEGCFLTAIETARRQQARAWELRATTSLARLWQRLGRRDEARAALAAVYDTFTEGFTTPDLVDARALLDSLT
jgi:serine/threonine protein kinase/class 3 adenylate cyclase/tetratricopeptide (TPR) repeat protein